jgi:uncharacterized membrane protein YfcA
MTASIVLFLFAGLIGGIVNSAAGGAKLFVFPMLLATGLPPIAANVTQAVGLWPAQLPAAWVYRRELAEEFRTLLRQMVPALIGAFIGAAAMVNSSEEVFISIVPLFLIVAVVAIILGPRTTDFMHWAFPGERLKTATAFLLALIGFYGGFFGAGMGFMLLAVLSASTGSGVSHVNGAKNMFAAAIQSVAVIPLMFSGMVDWMAAICVLIGGITGGYIGASITRRLPETYVRLGVAVLGLVLTLSFLLT